MDAWSGLPASPERGCSGRAYARFPAWQRSVINAIRTRTAHLRGGGFALDSGNRSGRGLVGRSPWTARDAPVPLPEAEAGASARRAPAARGQAGGLPYKLQKRKRAPSWKRRALVPSGNMLVVYGVPKSVLCVSAIGVASGVVAAGEGDVNRVVFTP